MAQLPRGRHRRWPTRRPTLTLLGALSPARHWRDTCRATGRHYLILAVSRTVTTGRQDRQPHRHDRPSRQAVRTVSRTVRTGRQFRLQFRRQDRPSVPPSVPPDASGRRSDQHVARGYRTRLPLGVPPELPSGPAVSRTVRTVRTGRQMSARRTTMSARRSTMSARRTRHTGMSARRATMSRHVSRHVSRQNGAPTPLYRTRSDGRTGQISRAADAAAAGRPKAGPSR